MVILWRRLVVWLRSLLIDIFLKKTIQWSNKFGELFGIIVDVLKMTENKTVSGTPKVNTKMPTIPDYNLVPKQPIRDFLRKLCRH